MKCQGTSRECTGEAQIILDYPVSKGAYLGDGNDVRVLIDGEDKIYRASVNACRNCGGELEKNLLPYSRDNLIIKRI